MPLHFTPSASRGGSVPEVARASVVGPNDLPSAHGTVLGGNAQGLLSLRVQPVGSGRDEVAIPLELEVRAVPFTESVRSVAVLMYSCLSELASAPLAGWAYAGSPIYICIAGHSYHVSVHDSP